MGPLLFGLEEGRWRHSFDIHATSIKPSWLEVGEGEGGDEDEEVDEDGKEEKEDDGRNETELE